jgi:hypothetical protein
MMLSQPFISRPSSTFFLWCWVSCSGLLSEAAGTAQAGEDVVIEFCGEPPLFQQVLAQGRQRFFRYLLDTATPAATQVMVVAFL